MRAMAKPKGKGREAGEGHVREHARGGYGARLYVPVKLRHLYGGKRELSFYGKTAEAALKKRAIGQRDLDERRGRAGGQTFGTYLSRWLDALYVLGSVSERTLQDYRYWARGHLIPDDKLGPVLLEDLTAEDLDLLYARLAKGGMGARAINHVHSTARVALQRAVKKRLIPYNPAKDADPPRYSTDEREYALLSVEDVSRFFEAAEGDRFEALWVMRVLAGPRPAELRALGWEDLTLPEAGPGSAVLRRSVVELAGEPSKIRNATKTGKPRSIPLLPDVVVALKAHRARQNAERLALVGTWQDNGLVFPTTTGTIMSRSNLSRRHFKPILKKANLDPKTRPYDLRHTFATLWMES
jgi:integrase